VKLPVAVIAFGSLALSGPVLAQEATTSSGEPISCEEILATPSASAEEIAALTDTSVVEVLQCREDANAVQPAAGSGVADLRAAVAASPAASTTLSAAGAAPEQVVAFRRGPNGEFMFYVIGGYR
jgi:hypothetical protein